MAESYIERAHLELQIESWSNSARTVLLRGFCTGGSFAEQHTTNADRSRATDTFQLHGAPINISAYPIAVPVRRGECYIRVTLLADGEPVLRLFAAYLTDGKTLTWPPGVHEGFTEGPGLIRSIGGTNPAAGAEISEAVPTNARWLVRGLYGQLIVDATVANRLVTLVLDDGTNVIYKIPDAAAQTASTTWDYYMSLLGESRVGATGASQIALMLPNLFLSGGYRVRTITVNLQAGDDYGAPRLEVEEWIEE